MLLRFPDDQPLAPVYGFTPFASRRQASAPNAWVTDAISDMKRGSASREQIVRLATELAAFVRGVPDFAGIEAIIPMPRRHPLAHGDLDDLAIELAQRLGTRALLQWLRRQATPTGGRHAKGRERFPPVEHARTMFVPSGGHLCPDKLLILDNAITLGGTMIGAQSAILRDTQRRALGLSVTYSTALEEPGSSPRAGRVPE